MEIDPKPQNPELYYDRGLVHYHCREYGKALVDFTAYLKMDPHGPYVQDTKKLRKTCKENIKVSKPSVKKFSK